MPCSCAASSASAICRAISRASSSGRGARASRADEILAVDELHDERADGGAGARRRVLDTVNLRDVWMVQRRASVLRLAHEALQAIRIIGELRDAGS